MSDSDSDSGSEQENMATARRIIKLTDIRTLSELYKSSILKRPSSSTQKYKPNASLLDRVSLFQGDITKLEVDSIVNAANKRLLGGGGVDGAIHAAAGRNLLEECRKLNGCETGMSKITKGYNLPSKHIIHTVGPVYSSSSVDAKAKLLASCYQTSLDLAVTNSLRHIAFPSISTGVYGYPIEDATHIALNVVRNFFDSEGSSSSQLERVIFVVWSDKDKDVYESLLPQYFPPSPGEALSPEPEPDSQEDSEGEPVPETQVEVELEEEEEVNAKKDLKEQKVE